MVKKKDITKNPSEGSKPFVQERAHGNDIKPLPPLLVWKGLNGGESILVVAIPLHLSLFQVAF
jgi:hypothetical protein